MKNVLVLGVGALGKRHLSSIINSPLALDIYCYDINPKALDGYEWNDTYGNKNLKQVSSLDELPDYIDFALFAMTANSRREMFDQLTSHTNVKNILFEKVLFQRLEDYDYVGKKLDELGIKAWVNCARRQMDSYQQLKQELKDAKEMIIIISGGEWGLACNAIHELDLVSFLSESNEMTINPLDELMPDVFESKRAGFKEVYGTISGKCGRCIKFVINCMKGTDVPDILSISTDIGQYYILEGKRQLISITKKNDFELVELPFEMPYQSQMTQFVMEDILTKGTSHLASYKESAKLHMMFIKPLITHFKKYGMEEDTCPIT